jgi:hypothetical protein
VDIRRWTHIQFQQTTFNAQTVRQAAITKPAYFHSFTFFTVNNKTDRNERKTTVPDTAE